MADLRNAYGAVGLADGGTPRTFTFMARANISGGYWVVGSTADNVVSSGADSYAASDIEGYPLATQIGSEVIGLNLMDTASGTYGVAAMRGFYILPVGSATRIGSIYAGWPVAAGTNGVVVPLGSNTLLSPLGAAGGIGAESMQVGKAMTTASNNGTGYVVVSLNI